MLVQASVRHTAQSATAAQALLMLLLLATRLSGPLGGNNRTAATSYEALPRLLLGACERGFLGGAFWRLRNHPFSETLVAKSSLLTHGDVYSVSRIAELGTSIGVGFQHLLEWLETLSVPQQVYAWKLFAGAEATQAFLSKFQGAEHLYGEGTAPRVLQRLKFVLNDGKLDVPTTTGVERLLSEAMAAYKAALFIFAGELCDAIARTDIVAFEKKLQDHLPLLKEILAGLLALCVRLDENVTKEYRTTLGRWLLKLFRLDSAALLLSPLSPPDQVLQRKLLADMGVDALGSSVPVGSSGPPSDGTSQAIQPGTPPAGDPRLVQHQPTPMTRQHTQVQRQGRLPSQFSGVATFSVKPEQGPQPATGTPPSLMSSTAVMTAAANGASTLTRAPLLSVFDLARQQALQASATMAPFYPVGAKLTMRPGIAAATLAPTLGGSIKQAVSSSLPARVQPSEGSLTPSFASTVDRGASSMPVHDRSLTRSAGTAGRGPGMDTLTSMAAMLRAEAASKNYASDLLTLGPAHPTATAAGQSTGVQDKYYLKGYILDGASRRTEAGERTMLDGSVSGSRQGILQGTTPTTGSGWASPAGDSVPRIEAETQSRGQVARQEVSTAGEKAPASSGYTMHYLVKLTEQDKVGGQEEIQDHSQFTIFQGARGGSSARSSQEANVLRAGSPLSAGELQTRLRTMDKLMQTSKSRADFEAATDASLPPQRRESVTQGQTVVQTLNTSAPSTTSPKAPLPTYAPTNTRGFRWYTDTTDSGLNKVTNAATHTVEKRPPTSAAGVGWEALKTPGIPALQVTLPTAAGGADSRTVATTTAADAPGALTKRETAAGLRTGVSSATAAGRRALETSKAAGGWGTVATSASPAQEEAFSTTAAVGERKTLAESAAAADNERLSTVIGTAGSGTLPAPVAAPERGEFSPSTNATEGKERRTAALAADQRTPPASSGRASGEPVVTRTAALEQGKRQTPTGPAGDEVTPSAAGEGENGTVQQQRSPAKAGTLAAIFASALRGGTQETQPIPATAAGGEAVSSSVAAERWGRPALSPTPGEQGTLSSRVAAQDEATLKVTDALQSKPQLWSNFENLGKAPATVRSPSRWETPTASGNTAAQKALSYSVGAEKKEKVESLKTAARETSVSSTGSSTDQVIRMPS